MKTVFYALIMFGLCSLYPGKSFSQAGAPSPAHSFAGLRNAFAKPDKQYGSAPLWVWHTKVTKAIIDSMMQEFTGNAFGGVMVHPRPGLINEYLSAEWYRLFQYTVQKGKALGLDVWIYDENSYPTGFAGGLLPDQMPESYNQGQMLRMSKATVLPDTTTDLFICLKEENGTFTDITAGLTGYKGKPGNYYLFKKEYYAKQAAMVGPPGYPYVDLMVKGVTEKFIDITFKGYEKVAGAEFGKTVPGIFSDEPTIQVLGQGIRWTPDLFSHFKQRWGYDLPTNLASLFEEVGDWRKVRHNHQAVLLDLFTSRWSKPMYEYTQKHHLKWTGHYWEHGWPSAQHGPDNMAMYAWHQQPGIDMLFNQFDEVSANAQFGNIRAVKELASVANQLGKKRTLSETYGGGGWELTFKDMKRLGDWQYALGVNFLNQHLSMMTVTGVRKYDYPQSFSYHAPWWPYYKNLNQYFARLSLALSQGAQRNDIVVIEPTTSAWMYTFNKKLGELGKQFQAFVTTLEKAQVEYDLGSEYIINNHGSVKNGQFVVGHRAYTTVVIPPAMDNIDLATFKLLKEFVAQGGKIVQFEKLQYIDGAANAALSVFDNNKIHHTIDAAIIDAYFRSTDFHLSGHGSHAVGGNLYHHRRSFTDGQLIFLSNADMNISARGRIQATGADALMLDLFTGEIVDYPEKAINNKVDIDFDVPAAGSMLLFIAATKQAGLKKYVVPREKKVIPTAACNVLRPVENTLMIDFCDVTIGATVLKDTHTFAASRAVFTRHGFSKNPWDHQVQFKDQFVARDTFSKGTGFTATYHFHIDAGVNYSQFRAAVEQGTLWNEITVNGVRVLPAANQWWLDRSNGVMPIGKYLRHGENTLSVTVHPMRVYAEIEPIFILGDFNLASVEHGWKITAPAPLQTGSWKNQGLPLYGQQIAYVKKVNISNVQQQQYDVQLHDWKGTVAAIKVNGVMAGIIMSEPNSLNITRYLRTGANTIEVIVAGSLKNLLGPHHNAPKPGMVGPGHWSNVRTHPAGDRYETFDYGLLQDFDIVQYDKR
jgi:hypothetical protein